MSADLIGIVLPQPLKKFSLRALKLREVVPLFLHSLPRGFAFLENSADS